MKERDLYEHMRESLADLTVTKFMVFCDIFSLILSTDEVNKIKHLIKDIDFTKRSEDEISISFLITTRDEETGVIYNDARLDLSVLGGRCSERNHVTGKVSRNYDYYCNFDIQISKSDEIMHKLFNLKDSNRSINKFNM